jgi:UDP-GlcNAc3NAcA epimerase
MPEEINRVIADRLSSLLFCPGGTAVDNLKAEGITAGVHSVGDIMFDVALNLGARAPYVSRILSTLELEPSGFAVATCHRAENTESAERLGEILSALVELAQTLKVLLPLHPGTLKQIRAFGLEPLLERLCVLKPLSFMDMAALLQSAALILTDSGGLQKEAFFYRVPCITLRDETEWVETVELGWNRLAGARRVLIVSMAREALVSPRPGGDEQPYGDGHSAQRIVSVLMQESR